MVSKTYMSRRIATPSIPRTGNTQEQLDALIEKIEVREGSAGRGDPLDQFITYRDMLDKGLIQKVRDRIIDPSRDTGAGTPSSDPDIFP